MKNDEHTSESVWKSVDEIYFAAVEIEDEGERTAFVEQACSGNDDVRREVNLLFSSQAEADEFFQEGPSAQISAEEIANTLASIPEFSEDMKPGLPGDNEIGKQIGPYKLLQKIGEGGGGNVYLAEQVKPVRRQVALKIIKLGMDTEKVIARFEAEQQALAMMEHPNIAHVLNAGSTETGRPFFVMELVHGIKITTYCDENGLDIRERLKLFIPVCHAIQHAHLKGIIHRDVKPSNVLITMHDDIPMPKVIDFGIAKATSGDLLTDETYHTSLEPFVGTPAYMSPEQADYANTDIDMRSDIYSLGILLYELMVGQTPFDQKELTSSGLDAMRRMLCETEPPQPATRFAELELNEQIDNARNRATDPHRLSAVLSDDVGWIVMKALEKDRNRRYQSADALAEDILRYLNQEPVVARPPSRLYRLQKMVRRNKRIFATIAAVSASLVIGLGTSSWLLIKEKEARKRAEVAEQQENQLRMDAVERQRISRAAFLISQEKYAEADKIVDEVSNIEPTTESEWVLRSLGEWFALHGNWERAANRFNLLLKVDVQDNSVATTVDIMMIGPVLIELGDMTGYERFRKTAIQQALGTSDPVFAERTLKICLLLPADQQTMKKLQSFADTASAATQGPMADFMEAWRCISLALMAYRQDYEPTAIKWCERARSFPQQNAARNATAQVIQAMAYFKLGEAVPAQTLLEQGREIIDARFTDGVPEGDADTGLWFDWIFARILLREAEALINQP